MVWLSGCWPRCSNTLAQAGGGAALQRSPQPRSGGAAPGVTRWSVRTGRAWTPVELGAIGNSGDKSRRDKAPGVGWTSRLGTNRLVASTPPTSPTPPTIPQTLSSNRITAVACRSIPEIHVAFYGIHHPGVCPSPHPPFDRASSSFDPATPSTGLPVLRPPLSLGRRVGAPQLRAMSRLYRSFQALFGPAGMASRLQSGQTVRIERVKIRKGKPTTRFL